MAYVLTVIGEDERVQLQVVKVIVFKRTPIEKQCPQMLSEYFADD